MYFVHLEEFCNAHAVIVNVECMKWIQLSGCTWMIDCVHIFCWLVCTNLYRLFKYIFSSPILQMYFLLNMVKSIHLPWWQVNIGADMQKVLKMEIFYGHFLGLLKTALFYAKLLYLTVIHVFWLYRTLFCCQGLKKFTV